MTSGFARLFVAALLSAAIAPPAGGTVGDRSPDGVWSETASSALQAAPRFEFDPTAEGVRTLRLDDAMLSRLLDQAPLERTAAARTSPLVLTLPLPDGSFARFRVAESPVLSDEMAAAQPGVRTYVAQGLDDPTHSARLGRTPLGFHAIVVTPDDFLFVERATTGPGDVYVSFSRKDLPAPEGLECSVDPSEARATLGATTLPSGAILHTFDLAIVTTGEFTSFYGGTTQTQAAVAVHVNQVNALYEREVAIRFRLVCLRMYTDRTTDPFTNPDQVDGMLISQANETLGLQCGAGAYQVGHLFHRRTTGEGFIGKGRAQYGTVCGGLKGRAASTATRPDWPQFVVDLVPHEIAHQFNANHTYNSQSGGCMERFGSAAFEVGAGTTIMSYACAGCTGEDPPGCADAYFHTHSLGEITTFRDDYAICGARTATGNTPPNVDAGPDRTIPRETPFTLTATGTDPDGDALTWTWEQYDLGAASPPLHGAVSGPLFRSFPATASPSRTFPNATDLLAGSPTPFEILPTVDRTLTFRATARDHRAGGGGVNHDAVVLTVRGTPFRLTAPNGGQGFGGGATVDVTWQVGGGSVAPNVNILFSSDGGQTFPVTLASGVPNDGVQAVTMPGVATEAARIRIEGAGNVFFDVSDANFSVQGTPPVAQLKGQIEASVDASGIASIPFRGSVTADCGISVDHVEVSVEVSAGGATVVPTIAKLQSTSNRVTCSGTVVVSNLSACPADVRVVLKATDACGAPASATLDVLVQDGIAPVVTAGARGGSMSATGIYILPFSGSVLDNSRIDVDDISVSVTNPNGNATLGTPVFVWRETTPGGPMELTGFVTVSNLRGPSVSIRVAVDARDGCQNFGSAAQEAAVALPTSRTVDAGLAVPTLTRLSGLRPNPFFGQTAIAFDLARAATVRLEVYSPAGARVRALAEVALDPGHHSVPWDGRDDSGRRVPAGVYFVRFAADGVVDTGKALLLP